MPHPKNELIDRAKKLGLKGPEFDTEKTGPEHEPRFQTAVRLDGAVIGRGEGTSRRAAEAAAAGAALGSLDARAAKGQPSAEKPATASGKTGEKSTKKAPAKKTAAEPAGTAKAAEKKQGKQQGKKAAKERDEKASKQAGKPAEAGASKRGGGGKAQQGKAAAPAVTAPATPPVTPSATSQAAARDAAPRPSQAQAASQAAQQPAAQDDEPFEGPWPMFDDLLAAALQIADRRVPGDLRGEAALAAVRDFSLRLYKDLLTDLGEVQDVDEDEEDS